jgi:hypothetical protein
VFSTRIPRAARAAALAGVVILLTAFSAQAADAATPGGWTKNTLLPKGASTSGAEAVGDPAGGSVLFITLASGVPAVAQVAASGTVAAAAAVPPVSGLVETGTPGLVAFTSSGAAVYTWTLTTYGTEYMAYRSAAGVWGSPVELPSGFSNLAVRAGEVVTSEATATGMSVESWTINGSGGLTLASGPTDVYTGSPLFNRSWLALDTSGTAALVVYGSTDNGNTESVSAVYRAAGGTWSAVSQLSAAGVYVSAAAVGVSPGGRAVVVWVDSNSTVAASSFASMRRAGVHFGAPVSTGTVSDSNGAFILIRAAGGPDGTLAASVTQRLYASNGISYTETTGIFSAKPTGTSVAGPVADPVGTFPSSLGAGADQAVVGTLVAVYGAGNASYASSYTATQEVSATIVKLALGSVNHHQVGKSSGLYDGNGSDGCPCPTSPPVASITGVSLDSSGNAAAVGQLVPGKPLESARYVAPTA